LSRAVDFDLARELIRPSFTPAQRDAPALVELIVAGDEAIVMRATDAVVGLGAIGRDALEARLATELDDGAHARVVAAFGRLARRGDVEARARVIAELASEKLRVRRAAAMALGKLGSGGGDDVVIALTARWDATDVPPDERRTLAEALGKAGGAAALGRLRALEVGDDRELARLRDRAVLMAERDGRRGESSEVAVDVAPPMPVAVRLHCKPGLAGLLVDELRALAIEGRSDGDASVEVALAAPWQTLFASRLWATGGIRIPRPAGDPSASIVAALCAPATRALLAALTRGPIRWRLDLPHGRERSVVWRVARDVTAAAPELVNDPTATTWDVRVSDNAVELVPRRAHDPRFAYRVADIPAASHPTVAAAIAWLAAPRANERVWDPFCGSGLELVECARRGAGSVVGSDRDDTALAAARANLSEAGVAGDVLRGDALELRPPGAPVAVIATNPPLGGRIRGDAGALLVRALPHFARQLASGGRLVWITPAPRTTTPVARALGLVLARSIDVDLGGIRGQLERWNKR